MQRTILIASNNPHKVQEIKAILPHLSFATPSELSLSCDPEETGTSFLDNALIKAEAFYSTVAATTHSHIIGVLAEDSGICVDALQGRPGIFSARYAMDTMPSHNTDPLYQCKHLLQELGTTHNRKAHFACCAVFMKNTQEFAITQTKWEGKIVTHTPSGTGGFGYDPIFYVPSQQCTSAELSTVQKNTCSHRARALRALSCSMKEFL